MEQIEFSIPKTPTFDVEQTLDCGQVFRFVKDGNAFKVCAKNHMARIEDKGCEYSVVCDDKDFFEKYFDFDTDYAAIQQTVQDGGFVSEAIEYGKGIHILRQDPIEAIFFVYNFAKQSHSKNKRDNRAHLRHFGRGYGRASRFPER